MNKLMGFLELREMNLPSVSWKRYTGNEKFNPQYLWTIRSAVYRGDVLNLPRLVGKKAEEAKIFADNLLSKMQDKGMVIYYPYFIAKKSGTLCVGNNKIIIEAVKDDLWNLVTYSDREVTVIIADGKRQIVGNEEFLSEEELLEIKKYIPEIKRIFRNDLFEGKDVLLEWSFASTCDQNRRLVDEEKLLFYEVRTI